MFGAAAVYLFTGLQMHHAYAADCHPASSLACGINFSGRYGTTGAQRRPAGDPGAGRGVRRRAVLAREFETGTFRYAWTQGFGRTRWTIGKLVRSRSR